MKLPRQLRTFGWLLSVSGAYGIAYGLMIMWSVFRTWEKEKQKGFLNELYKEFKRNKQTYFCVALHILDQASDIEACAEYFQQSRESDGFDRELDLNPEWWFTISVGILIVHRVVSTVMIWRNTHNLVNTALQLLDLAMVRAVIDGISQQRDEPGNVERMLQSTEAIFESFPQLVLSLVYLLRTKQANPAIVIQALFSIYTLSLRICNDDAAFFPEEWRKAKFKFKCPPSVNRLWCYRVFLFRLPEIFTRVAVISLFWALVGGDWLCLLIPADFILCKCCSLSSGLEHDLDVIDLDWKSTWFFATLLYYKPGNDAEFVWYFLRPVMSLVYIAIGIAVTITEIPHRIVIIESPLSVFMITIVIVSLFLPCLFVSLMDEDDKNYFLHNDCKRDLKTAILNQRFDVVYEMVRVGTDPMLVLKESNDLTLIPILLEGWQPMINHFLPNQSGCSFINCGQQISQTEMTIVDATPESLIATVIASLHLKYNRESLSMKKMWKKRQILNDLLSLSKSKNNDNSDARVYGLEEMPDELIRMTSVLLKRFVDALMNVRSWDVDQQADTDGTPLFLLMLSDFVKSEDEFDLFLAKYTYIHRDGIDAGGTDRKQRNALHICLENPEQLCDNHILEWFLKDGSIDPNVEDENEHSPLRMASMKGNLEAMETLLSDDQVELKDEFVWEAVDHHCLSTLRVFINVGYDPARTIEGKNLFDLAIEQKKPDLIPMLIRNGQDEFGLVYCIMKQIEWSKDKPKPWLIPWHQEINMEYLWNLVEDPKDKLARELVIVISQLWDSIVRLKYPNPHISDVFVDLLIADEPHDTSVEQRWYQVWRAIQIFKHKMIEMKKSEKRTLMDSVVSYLISNDPFDLVYALSVLCDKKTTNVDEIDKRMKSNVLHICAADGNAGMISLVRLLLTKQVIDPDQVDIDGRTPLMIATMNQHKMMMSVLLDHGCNKRTCDTLGMSALDHANDSRNTVVIDLLMDEEMGYGNEVLSLLNHISRNPSRVFGENGAITMSRMADLTGLVPDGCLRNLMDVMNVLWSHHHYYSSQRHDSKVSGFLSDLLSMDQFYIRRVNGLEQLSDEQIQGARELIRDGLVEIMEEHGWKYGLKSDQHGLPLFLSKIIQSVNLTEPLDVSLIHYLYSHRGYVESDAKAGIFERNALHYCVLDKDLGDVLRLLLDDGQINPNEGDSFDNPPLYFSAMHGNTEAVRILLEDPRVRVDQANKHGWTALMTASLNDHSSIVSLLLDHGADPHRRSEQGNSALDAARLEDNTDVERLMLDFIDEDEVKDISEDALIEDIAWIMLDRCPVIASDSDQLWTRMSEILADFPDYLTIDYTAELNEDLVPIVSLKLEEFIESGNPSDLFHAKLLYSHQKAVSVDLTYGGKNHQILHYCASDSRLAGMLDWLLIRYDMDVNLRDNHHLTPLIWAAIEGCAPCVKVLLNHHSDKNITDEPGFTALDHAFDRCHPKVICILTDDGKDTAAFVESTLMLMMRSESIQSRKKINHILDETGDEALPSQFISFLSVVLALMEKEDDDYSRVLDGLLELGKKEEEKWPSDVCDEHIDQAHSMIDDFMVEMMRKDGWELGEERDDEGYPLFLIKLLDFIETCSMVDLMQAKHCYLHRREVSADDTVGVMNLNALHLCALHPALNEMLKWLLNHGDIDPNIKDSNGYSPLMSAIRVRNFQASEILSKDPRIDDDVYIHADSDEIHSPIIATFVSKSESSVNPKTLQNPTLRKQLGVAPSPRHRPSSITAQTHRKRTHISKLDS